MLASVLGNFFKVRPVYLACLTLPRHVTRSRARTAALTIEIRSAASRCKVRTPRQIRRDDGRCLRDVVGRLSEATTSCALIVLTVDTRRDTALRVQTGGLR